MKQSHTKLVFYAQQTSKYAFTIVAIRRSINTVTTVMCLIANQMTA